MAEFEHDGWRLSYTDTGGDGPAVLLQHGLLFDRTMFDPQVDALPKVLNENPKLIDPKLIYITPNFQNPQGTTLTLERREKLVALLREYGWFLAFWGAIVAFGAIEFLFPQFPERADRAGRWPTNLGLGILNGLIVSSLPVLSVWPATSITVCSNSFTTLPTELNTSKKLAFRSELSVLKVMLPGMFNVMLSPERVTLTPVRSSSFLSAASWRSM